MRVIILSPLRESETKWVNSGLSDEGLAERKYSIVTTNIRSSYEHQGKQSPQIWLALNLHVSSPMFFPKSSRSGAKRSNPISAVFLPAWPPQRKTLYSNASQPNFHTLNSLSFA